MPSTHAYVHFAIDPVGLDSTRAWPTTRSMTTSSVLGGICEYLLQLASLPGQRARERSDQMLELLLDLFVKGPLAEPEADLHPYIAVTIAVTQRAWARAIAGSLR